MRKLIFLFLALIPMLVSAVTFDVDGLRFEILSKENKSVAIAIIPKSISYPSYSTYTGDIVVPSKVTYNNIEFDVVAVGDHAFSNCPSSLTSVQLPTSIKSIGFGAFSNSYGLKELTIPEGVTTIGAAAFHDSNFEKLYIPNSVTEFGSTMFNNSSYLKEVHLPEGLKFIPESTFSRCISLQTVNIPSGITEIGNGAFMSTSSLSTINIPSGVTKIGNSAFYNSGVTQLIIPDGVTVIEPATFYGCQKLTTIKLPAYLTELGKESFRQCQKLTAITVPEGITKIHSYTFQYCMALAELNLPSTLELIDSDAFAYCQSLTKLHLPEGFKKLWSEAFWGAKITDLYFPNTIEYIGGWAFGLGDIKKMDLPASLTSIGSYAFDNAKYIEEITCHWQDPFACETSIFYNGTYLSAKLFVPKGTKAKYESTKPWSEFFIIVEQEETGIEDVLLNTGYNFSNGIISFNKNCELTIYSAKGQEIYKGNTNYFRLPYKGVFILNVNGKSYKLANY